MVVKYQAGAQQRGSKAEINLIENPILCQGMEIVLLCDECQLQFGNNDHDDIDDDHPLLMWCVKRRFVRFSRHIPYFCR